MNDSIKKKYFVTKEMFMEMIIVVIYLDTCFFEDHNHEKYNTKNILSKEEFKVIYDKYKELAILFGYLTIKELNIYDNVNKVFLKQLKSFSKKENYPQYETLVDKFADIGCTEKEMKEVYKYFADEIINEFKECEDKKKKEVEVIIKTINLKMIRKLNKLYEETEFKD